MSKESEPQYKDFDNLSMYGEALALFRDKQYIVRLYKELKHFKDINENSVQTEIVQADIFKELQRLNPEGKLAIENGDKITKPEINDKIDGEVA